MSGPLPNIKHEAFALDVVKSINDPNSKPCLTDSYQKVYGCARATADTKSSVLANNPDVRSRMRELLEADEETSEVGVGRKLKELYHAQKESVRLGAVRLTCELNGSLRPQNIQILNQTNVNVDDEALEAINEAIKRRSARNAT